MDNNLLKQLLTEHKRVVIPEFGAFLRKETPEGGYWVFSPFLRRDDGVVVETVAREYGVDIEDARAMTVEYVIYLKQSLASAGHYYIEGLGALQVDANGSVTFKEGAVTPPPVVETQPVERPEMQPMAAMPLTRPQSIQVQAAQIPQNATGTSPQPTMAQLAQALGQVGQFGSQPQGRATGGGQSFVQPGTGGAPAGQYPFPQPPVPPQFPFPQPQRSPLPPLSGMPPASAGSGQRPSLQPFGTQGSNVFSGSLFPPLPQTQGVPFPGAQQSAPLPPFPQRTSAVRSSVPPLPQSTGSNAGGFPLANTSEEGESSTWSESNAAQTHPAEDSLRPRKPQPHRRHRPKRNKADAWLVIAIIAALAVIAIMVYGFLNTESTMDMNLLPTPAPVSLSAVDSTTAVQLQQ